MGRINFSVHPLFFLVGFYFALTGKIFVFIIYTLTAVLHEIGHSIVSENLGYRLNKISLMPFGAVAFIDMQGLKLIDQVKIALAGPLLNIAISLLFISFWWIFPESYAVTELAVEANLTMALINFIPAYPLDGGRVLSSVLAMALNRKKSRKICKIVGVVFSITLIALFIISLFNTPNLSLLFFSLFVLFGALEKDEENEYVSVFTFIDGQSLLRGAPYKKQAVDQNVKIKKLIAILDARAINEIVVFENGRAKTVLSQEKIINILKTADLYSPLKQYI